MPLVLADRVRDTTTTTGTGTITLSGTAPTGYQNFSVIGNGNTTYYTINAGSQWEVGIGTYSSTGPTLARTTVLESSNGGALVNFSAGVKDVFVTYPADEVVIQDGATIAAGTAVLGVANGGTGLSSTPANGAIDIGNGTGFTRTTLTAGTNISITNGAGSITINAADQFVGTVTSVAASGGTTGMTFSGSPITTSGTLTLGGTLNVANGGTGATTLSSGYLLKGNGTSAVSASVVFDDGTNVGIGTSAPGVALDVAGDAVRVTRAVSPAAFLGRQGNGTLASPTATVSGNQIVVLAGSGHNGSAYTATPSAAMRYLALENFTATANGAAITFETTPIGSSTAARAERMRIDGSGNVGIGTTAPSALLNVYSATGAFIDLFGDAGTTISAVRSSTDATGANMVLRKARGTTASRTAVASGDTMGTLFFSAFGGTNNRNIASIVGTVGTYTSDADISSNLIFNTTPTGSVSPTERMRIDSSGNVGIGTSSPGFLLHGVQNGNAEFRVSATNVGTNSAGVTVENQGNRNWNLWANRSTDNFIIGANSRANDFVVINGSTGNVGIGNSSPLFRLDTLFNSNANVGMKVQNQSTNQFAGSGLAMCGPSAGAGASIYYYNSNAGGTVGAVSLNRTDNAGNYQATLFNYEYSGQAWQFMTNNTERMRIDSSGRVGIGTSVPSALLDVRSAAGTDSQIANRAGNAAYMVLQGTSFPNFNQVQSFDGSGNLYWSIGGSGTANTLAFLTNGSNERMRIDSSGNVGIGLTGPQLPLSIGKGGGAPPATSGSTQSSGGIARLGSSGAATLDVGTLSSGSAWLQATNVTNLASNFDMLLNPNGGNVGIGTSSPGVRLDVAGGAIRVGNTHSMQFRNAAGTGVAVYTLQSDDNFVVYNATGTPISSFTQGSTNIAVYGSNTNNRMQVDSINSVTSWFVNGSERARINSSGQFLIGTTSGGRTVCINAADNWIRQSNPSRSWLIGNSIGTSYNIYDETAGATRFSIDTNGVWNGPNAIVLGQGQNLDNRIELGAGRTGNNFAYVDLIGDTTYTDYGLRLLRGNGGPNATSELNHRGTGPFSINVQDAGVLIFSTSNTERMRFEAAGSASFSSLIVGRNTTGSNVNTNNDTGSFSVRGDASNAASISFHRVAAYAINMGLGTDAVFRIGGWSASSNCFQMDGSGNLTMLGNVTAYSDARIKKDVETIDGALDLVSKMRGVRYTRTDTDKRGVGVIAQEMLEVVPEVVQQGVGDDDTLSVAYGNLVGVLIEAIKELRAEVAELKGK